MTSRVLMPEFSLSRVRFKVGSLGLTLPEYAGGILRGGFGMALNKVDPRAWNHLFGNAREDSLFVPYMLVPPSSAQRVFEAGETFEFELRLFGQANEYFQACCEALSLLGNLGIGRERGKYALLAAANILPPPSPENEPLFSKWCPVPATQPVGSAADWFIPAGREQVESVELRLQTPLRLKSEDRLVGDAPAFLILWRRLYARVSLAAGQSVLSSAEKKDMDRSAGEIATAGSEVRWVDWVRYSARQDVTMKFGGLAGTLRYHGALEPFTPWLNLGTAIGVGSKTTFGLGCYTVSL